MRKGESVRQQDNQEDRCQERLSHADLGRP